MEVTILGNNSALAAHGRHPSAQWIKTANQAILIDCGEGTQFRIAENKIKTTKLTYILISHLHGDHYFGLGGLLTRFNLLGRKAPVTLFGPPDLQDILQLIFKAGKVVLQYPLEIHTLSNPGMETLIDLKDLTIQSFPIHHRLPTWGFRITRKFRDRRMIKSKIDQFRLTFEEIKSLKKGQSISRPDGSKVTSHEATLPPKPDVSYTYCSDTQYEPKIIPFIQQSDALYHESTFLDAHRVKAWETKHSTAMEAAKIAKEAQVKRLLLGHYSSRYADLNPLLEEARSIFPSTDLSIEGESIMIGAE